MADATEDTIELPQEDADPADEVADFRFLASKKLPSRGTKDFEPHGTKLQQSTLEASRQAMYDVLNQTRTHNLRDSRAVWDAETGGAWVINPGGKWTVSVGQSRRCPGKGTRLWLLPEETLWLIDRGSLDVRWPAIPGEEEEDGMPMSLQGAYAVCIRSDSAHPLSLEMYSVYAYLKRAGYIVVRENSNPQNTAKDSVSKAGVLDSGLLHFWRSLFKNQATSQQISLGPLVAPGIYHKYGIYPENNDRRARQWLTTCRLHL
jgi:tRNA-splicing endonuclease subunit Sen54